MKPIMLSIVSLALCLGLATALEASPPPIGQPPGKYVTVWLLEIKYKAGDSWHVAGKYTSLASAQESYFVRARHGGYYDMRIRETQEWRSIFADPARVRVLPRYFR